MLGDYIYDQIYRNKRIISFSKKRKKSQLESMGKRVIDLLQIEYDNQAEYIDFDIFGEPPNINQQILIDDESKIPSHERLKTIKREKNELKQKQKDSIHLDNDDIQYRYHKKRDKRSEIKVQQQEIQNVDETNDKSIRQKINENSQNEKELFDIKNEINKNDLNEAQTHQVLQNLDQWMGLSRKNMQLQQRNTKYRQELQQERSIRIKKNKNSNKLFERIKKRNTQLIDQNEIFNSQFSQLQSLYAVSLSRIGSLTEEIVRKDKQILDFLDKLTILQTQEIQQRYLIEQKQAEIDFLKNCKTQTNKNVIEQSCGQMNISSNINQIDETPIDTNIQSTQYKEGQIGQDEFHSNKDMLKVFCYIQKRSSELMSELEKKKEQITLLEKDTIQKTSIELQLKLITDEFELIQQNNQKLSNKIVDKEKIIYSLQNGAVEVVEIQRKNLRLSKKLIFVQKKLKKQNRLLMEQEVLHRVNLDYNSQKSKNTPLQQKIIYLPNTLSNLKLPEMILAQLFGYRICIQNIQIQNQNNTNMGTENDTTMGSENNSNESEDLINIDDKLSNQTDLSSLSDNILGQDIKVSLIRTSKDIENEKEQFQIELELSADKKQIYFADKRSEVYKVIDLLKQLSKNKLISYLPSLNLHEHDDWIIAGLTLNQIFQNKNIKRE